MTKVTYIFCVVTLLFCLSSCNIPVSEIMYDEEIPEYRELSVDDENVDVFLEKIDIKAIEEEPSKHLIKCFDANENGDFAIGTELRIGISSSMKNQICIYSQDQEFICGYQFIYRENFGIDLQDNIFTIYFFADNYGITMDFEGKILKVIEITGSNSGFYNQLRSHYQIINGEEYEATNENSIIPNLNRKSMLSKCDSKGQEIILYEASVIIVWENNALIVAFIVVFIFGIILSIKKFI